MEALTPAPDATAHHVQRTMQPQVLTAGRPWPMGAHCDAGGINFAVFSAHAQAVDLCIFDASGNHEIARARLPGRSGDVWHGHLPNAGPGLVYGLRAHGPWRPDRGHRFNPMKLLLDPYAREIVGQFDWADEHFSADRQHPRQMDMRDNAQHAMKARVTNDEFDWRGDHSPRTSLAESVIYEAHVKGFSRLNLALPERLRGTFAGLAHPASIKHLQDLGITAVSLLPVHQHVDEERLVNLGLGNYWGYNTIGFFCPDPRFASGTAANVRDEFRAMVLQLHGAGIEVLLDVVFNHTAEGDSTGPSISFQGLDNAAYYRLQADAPLIHENHTGCGNTLDLREPRVLQLVMDSLRYWVTEMHVDGYRFDLATVLGRGNEGFDRHAAFFTAVAQDPVLQRVKLIAEPWDVGPGGYQVGGFPNGWPEWNDKFRDDMRSFWLGHTVNRGAFARRLSGSSDLYQARGRSPLESVNYTISHDGFTLRDLLTFERKRNEANGENNRDGTDNNLGFNCGVEGPTNDANVNMLRGRLQRALLATTLLAQGLPMLCAGDEIGHSQRGNNNPYCQDNPTTWLAWPVADTDLLAFTTRVLALRRAAQPFGVHWYSGLTDPLGLHDLAWLEFSGATLQGDAWNDSGARTLACLIGEPGRSPAPLLLFVNAEARECEAMLPAGVWEVLLDSSHPRGMGSWHGQGETPLVVPANSLLLLAAAGALLKV